jgi:hypothetical protein
MTKLALVVGINNYPGTGSDLAGCVNDANDWASALDHRGFGIGLLLDGDATRAVILSQLNDMVGALTPGDTLVFTYSGHGSYQPDLDGDEPDRRDETLCPHDIRATGPITDDQLYELFSGVPHGTRVVTVADSCFSGTLHRFADFGGDGVGRARFLPPEAWSGMVGHDRAWQRAAALPPKGRPRAGALVMAGASDREFAYDASFGGRPNGAYTYAALKALAGMTADDTPVSYQQWHRRIRTMLPSDRYPQTPQLDGLSRQKRWVAFG